jgi:glutathione S-transferase
LKYRFVRETLDTLEIPYIAHNLGKGSPKRKEFESMSGKMQFPYLVDENTGKRMFESTDIVQYLYDTYAPRLKKE